MIRHIFSDLSLILLHGFLQRDDSQKHNYPAIAGLTVLSTEHVGTAGTMQTCTREVPTSIPLLHDDYP
jgi:hypothetical protein